MSRQHGLVDSSVDNKDLALKFGWSKGNKSELVVLLPKLAHSYDDLLSDLLFLCLPIKTQYNMHVRALLIRT